MVKDKEWTDEEVERLRELYTSNRTFEEIAERFPLRTDNAIRLKASRLGLKRPIVGNIIQMRPLSYKPIHGKEICGYLIKCRDCGSWIQVDEETQQRTCVLSCAKCGSFYQVLGDF